MNQLEAIVFDFDGTIADTMPEFVNIYNTILAPAFKIKPIKESDTDEFRSKDPHDLFSAHSVNILKLPLIVAKARKELTSKIKNIKPHKNIPFILEKLHCSGIRLGICTSNSQKNVSTFLALNKMSGIFDFIYTGKHLFGKHKVLQKLLREQHLAKDATLFVGDEIRDIEAAHSAGLKVAAVTWGFNNREALKNLIPDHLIDTPEQLLSFI